MIPLLRILTLSEEYLGRKGVPQARTEARRLLAHGLGLAPIDLFLQHDRPLTELEIRLLRDLVARRGRLEPLQHLLGTVAFRHLELACDARALVPRPETEELVDHALAAVQGRLHARVLDVGTGSGCIALALRQERPDLRVLASDIDSDALALARQNARRLGLWVPMVQGDLLDGFARRLSFDLIVSNPPYVAREDLPGLPAEVRADPRRALDGGPGGLELVARLVEQARFRVSAGGHLIVEHGYNQGPLVRQLAQSAGWLEVRTHRDLSGHDRFLTARAPDPPD